MKMFIPLLCLLSLTIAEPPVGDSYAPARSSHGYEHNDFQKSPSLQYGFPSQIPASRNSLSSEYGSPKGRSSARLSSTYGPPNSGISEEYGVPNSRSTSKLSQEYGVPVTRNSPSQEYGVPETRNVLSQEYGAPSARKALSQQYGVSSAQNAPSQKYGIPNSRNAVYQEYGVPKSRKAPSEEYGIPAPLQEYDVPLSRSFNQEYGTANAKQSSSLLSRNIELTNPSSVYGAPRKSEGYDESEVPNARQSSSYKSRNFESTNPSSLYETPRKPSEVYGTPDRISKSRPSSLYLPQKFSFNDVSSKSSFNSKSLFKSTDAVSTYGAPKIGSLSYEVPSSSSEYSQGFNDFGARVSDKYDISSRTLSQEYGAPRTGDSKTNAVASSYSSARSPLSSTYGVPSTRDSVPSEVYGVPEQYNARSTQGYDYARANDEDIQEPANYDFAYKVNDYITGSDFGHTESRQENRAEGTYFVVLPDGNKQVVEYEADERGFKPRISVEPAEARYTGYDDNAADLTDSSSRPY